MITIQEPQIIVNFSIFSQMVEFILHTSSCEPRNALINILRNRIGDKCNLEIEEFENHVREKIEGFCSTVHKEWMESNR